jgi:hypothetical protein
MEASPQWCLLPPKRSVPDDLRQLVGKREEKRSLETRDPTEAKRRHAEALADVEVRWTNLRAGPKALTEREAHQLAVTVHDRWLRQHQENPSQQTAWNVDLADRLFAPPRRLKSYDIADPDFECSMDEDSLQISGIEKWCFEIANECLAARGFASGRGWPTRPGRRSCSSVAACKLDARKPSERGGAFWRFLLRRGCCGSVARYHASTRRIQTTRRWLGCGTPARGQDEIRMVAGSSPVGRLSGPQRCWQVDGGEFDRLEEFDDRSRPTAENDTRREISSIEGDLTVGRSKQINFNKSS